MAFKAFPDAKGVLTLLLLALEFSLNQTGWLDEGLEEYLSLTDFTNMSKTMIMLM